MGSLSCSYITCAFSVELSRSRVSGTTSGGAVHSHGIPACRFVPVEFLIRRRVRFLLTLSHDTIKTRKWRRRWRYVLQGGESKECEQDVAVEARIKGHFI